MVGELWELLVLLVMLPALLVHQIVKFATVLLDLVILVMQDSLKKVMELIAKNAQLLTALHAQTEQELLLLPQPLDTTNVKAAVQDTFLIQPPKHAMPVLQIA